MPVRHKLDESKISTHPVWSTVSLDERQEIIELTSEGLDVSAITRLRETANCSLSTALNAFHEVSLGISFVPSVSDSPCPNCGESLRNDAARQCFSCGADWH